MSRGLRIALGVAVLLGVIVVASTPSELRHDPAILAPQLPAPDENPAVVPNAEKLVTWVEQDQRTEWAVVYIHGFSATRQETAPLARNVASALGANLFETRLRGHGLVANPLTDITAEDWLDDTVEALAAGAALGDKVIAIGTSTGATLLTALIDHDVMNNVDSLVFLSPNFGLHDDDMRMSTGPAGRILLRLAMGETMSWESLNPAYAVHWANHYPTASLIEMVRVMDRVDARLPISSDKRWLVIYSENDTTVSPQATVETMSQIDAAKKSIIPVVMTNDTTNHVIAGDLLSPDTTDARVQEIVEFIRHPAP